MPAARYALRPADLDHGVVCPECAGPKHRQSGRCAACYYDARRRGEYPDPPDRTGCRPGNFIDGTRGHRATGRSSSRPQPQSHPWRGKNELLFRERSGVEGAA